MEIREYTQAQMQELYERAVREEIKKKSEATVAAFFRMDGARVAKDAMDLVLRDLTPAIRQKAEEWIVANLDRVIEIKAKELVQATIGTIKRRLEGR